MKIVLTVVLAAIFLAAIWSGYRRGLILSAAQLAAIVVALYGAALLTFSAAFIESLWSPGRWLPFEVKVGIGLALWALLLAYFAFAGRIARAD